MLFANYSQYESRVLNPSAGISQFFKYRRDPWRSSLICDEAEGSLLRSWGTENPLGNRADAAAQPSVLRCFSLPAAELHFY